MIPLERVAEDQRPLIAAFREAGCKSFQDAATMAEARRNYEVSSAANGLAPDAVASVEDVRVGDFAVRVYDDRAERSAADAVIVFVHGGGWVMGSLSTHDPVCRRLATRTGLPVVAVDYRLGPEHRFPAAHLDGRAAVEWVRDAAESRGWDASRIVVVGDSAGGGIATALAAEPSMQVPGTSVVAQVLLYPVVDLSAESPGYSRIAEGFPLTADSMRWFAEHFLASPDDARDPRVSPLLRVRAEAEAARDGAADGALVGAADARATAPGGAGHSDAEGAVPDRDGIADAHTTTLGRAGAPDTEGGGITGPAVAAAGAQPPAWILALGLDPLGDEAVEYARHLATLGTHVELIHLPHHAHGLFTSAGRIRTGEQQLEQAAAFILRHR
ncbi:alpha/beta hydrolase [Gulosibacter sp. 10]|uniref:alpha/beta hydrolase n=1 Tax=Gulosibacter sp. 10 TaxID=1255570 RepID=UPI00097F31C1|nr:alpha/beta hydrolase [Gulosibacter sp. 10]SJM59916.1 putative esterase [Gulosibacter sp. 10]